MAERFGLELSIMSKILRLQSTQSALTTHLNASNPPQLSMDCPQKPLLARGAGVPCGWYFACSPFAFASSTTLAMANLTPVGRGRTTGVCTAPPALEDISDCRAMGWKRVNGDGKVGFFGVVGSESCGKIFSARKGSEDEVSGTCGLASCGFAGMDGRGSGDSDRGRGVSRLNGIVTMREWTMDCSRKD
jgi:hypothetical protein